MPSPSTKLERPLLRWIAVQNLHDHHARLVEAGAHSSTQAVDLSSVFVDLPLIPERLRDGTTAPPWMAMPQLLTGTSTNVGPIKRVLTGGPGSGKSTLTTMLAHVLRIPWVERQMDDLPADLRESWERAHKPLQQLVSQFHWDVPECLLPIRVQLPLFARWRESQKDPATKSLWHYLTERMLHDRKADGDGNVNVANLTTWIQETESIYWIFDGLDEVPEGRGRRELIAIVHELANDGRRTKSVLIATRPHGYENDFPSFNELDLAPLSIDIAQRYAENLVRAWASSTNPHELSVRISDLHQELNKPEAATLLHTPLHTAMATLLVTKQGGLPQSRYLLFQEYFKTILNREYAKPNEGITIGDGPILTTLHARAGLLLHVRAQQNMWAQAGLRRNELRKILETCYHEQGFDTETTNANVERIMQLAVERLVLLLHSADGEYEFGIRSLEEFFAAEALTETTDSSLEHRLAAIAISAHWDNVIEFLASRAAAGLNLKHSDKQLSSALVTVCERLRDGSIGHSLAQRCFLGSRLALRILQETHSYGFPALHNPMWDIATRALQSPAGSDIAALAAIWPGPQKERIQALVLDVAQSQLDRDEDAQLLGWRLLYPLLCARHERAEALATKHAPQHPEQARAFMASMLFRAFEVAPWIRTFITHHQYWFFPQFHFAWGTDAQQPIVALYSSLLLDDPEIASPWIDIHTHDNSCTWRLRSIQSGSLWNTLIAQLTDAPDSWRLWKRLAIFMATPSADHLADVLDAIDDDALWTAMTRWSSYLPWPLARCLYHVDNHQGLSSLTKTLRLGQLGSTQQWRDAEERWSHNGRVHLEDVVHAHTTKEPWDAEIASQGTSCMWPLRYEINGEVPITIARMLRRPEMDIHSMLSSPLCLAPDLQGSNRDAWFDLLDARGRVGNNRDLDGTFAVEWMLESAKTNIRVIAERLCERPDQWGLLDALVALFFAAPDNDLALRLPHVQPNAPPRAHALQAVVTLLESSPDPSTRPALLRTLVFEEAGTLHDFRGRLGEILGRRHRASEPAASLLVAALDMLPSPNADVQEILLNALTQHVRRSATPAFLTPTDWKKHELPEPYLLDAPATSNPPILRSITLNNIRLFQETPLVDKPFPIPEEGRGQCIVLIGENGVGKTTLLRAIALALASPEIASDLLDKRIPFLQNKNAEGRILVNLDSSQCDLIIRRGIEKELVEATTPNADRPWVVGYGVRRGDPLGEPDRSPIKRSFGALHTLFGHAPSPHAASRWLADLDADVGRERRRAEQSGTDAVLQRASVWEAVKIALQRLVGIEEITVEIGGEVVVQHPRFGLVPLQALSDGYLVTAGWIVDMIARWIERQDALDKPVGTDILQQMTGFALIDEIDQHLHPRWQMSILHDIRELFPRMSFIVTTHNPLTLQGARPGEVYVVRWSDTEEKRIELVQKDIRPGYDVDRVLLEQFGLVYTFDRETRKLLEKNLELLRQGVPAEAPERQALNAQIGAALGSVGEKLLRETEIAFASPAVPPAERKKNALAYMQVKKARDPGTLP